MSEKNEKIKLIVVWLWVMFLGLGGLTAVTYDGGEAIGSMFVLLAVILCPDSRYNDLSVKCLTLRNLIISFVGGWVALIMAGGGVSITNTAIEWIILSGAVYAVIVSLAFFNKYFLPVGSMLAKTRNYLIAKRTRK